MVATTPKQIYLVDVTATWGSPKPLIGVRIPDGMPNTEGDAGALVRRPALKTGFSEMGWGSTPPPSAKIWKVDRGVKVAGC